MLPRCIFDKELTIFPTKAHHFFITIHPTSPRCFFFHCDQQYHYMKTGVGTRGKESLFVLRVFVCF